MKIFKLFMVLAVMAFMTSCGEDEDGATKNPAEMLVGTWTLQSQTALGITFTDGESTLTFNTCDGGVCTGADYNGYDQTTGSFTYVLSSDGKTITITDDEEEGGSYSGEWDVSELTSGSLKFGSDSFLGEISFNLSK